MRTTALRGFHRLAAAAALWAAAAGAAPTRDIRVVAVGEVPSAPSRCWRR